MRDLSHLPRWLDERDRMTLEISTRAGGPIWRCRRPRLEAWSLAGEGLRATRRRLQAMPIERIVAAIGRAAARFLDPADPLRRDAIDDAARATLFSREAVAESLDVELANYRPEALRATLERELGDPRVLDGFRPDARLGGQARAVGPAAILAVFTGNIPGLPALALVRALLVKSPVIAKVAGGEPTFAGRFVAALADEEPVLGDAVLCTYWQREEEEVLAAALAQVDTVMVYGGAEACRALRARVLPGQRFLEHGHKVSVGLLTEDYLAAEGRAAVAAAVARDASVFNQHACIAPQAYFLAAPPEVAAAFGPALAAALGERARRVPLGRLEPADAAALQLARAGAAWREAEATGRQRVWHADGLDWTLVEEPTLGGDAGAGNRFLRLVVVPDLDAALAQIAPLAPYLQNVALGAHGVELERAAERLAALGACRICEPGRMADPSLMWRHDGRACVAELVRWCDVEMHRGFPLEETP